MTVETPTVYLFDDNELQTKLNYIQLYLHISEIVLSRPGAVDSFPIAKPKYHDSGYEPHGDPMLPGKLSPL